MRQGLTLTTYGDRYWLAGIVLEEGIQISVISEVMGHDSDKTTQIYLASLKTEFMDKDNRKVMKFL